MSVDEAFTDFWEELMLIQMYLEKGGLVKALKKCSVLQVKLLKLKQMQVEGSGFDDWDKVPFQETEKILHRLNEELRSRVESGDTGEESGSELLEMFGGIRTGGDADTVSWKSTAERLGAERDRLEEELAASEQELLEVYQDEESN